jgi:hypothetical protein
MGSIDAKDAVWLNLTLAKSVSVLAASDAVWPACFPDINGQIYLRGHVTLAPVPAVGGGMLSLLPMSPSGECVCTPLPDAGSLSNNVIVSTTSIAYPRETPNLAEVCIVRLRISLILEVDVNMDMVVNDTDLALVQNSLFYNFNLTAPSTCPVDASGQRNCGRTDVNGDGFVNQLDTTAITQSMVLPCPVPCGGVYATAFSCGSRRAAPLTPAVDISFDSIVFFNNDGLSGAEAKRDRVRASLDRSLFETVVMDMHDMRFELESRMDGKVAAVDSKLESRVAAVRSEVAAEVTHLHAKDRVHDRALRASVSPSSRDMFVGVFVMVAGVILAGSVIYLLAKKK